MTQYTLLSLLLIFACSCFSYSPSECTVESYYFTFLRDSNGTFKVHGLWPESCAQCETCGYPSCCVDLPYTYPNDPTDFITNKWFYSLSYNDCNGEDDVILFEHEYYKHGSCMGVANSTEYLNYVIELYDEYYDSYVDGKCDNHSQLWLYLNQNEGYVETICD